LEDAMDDGTTEFLITITHTPEWEKENPEHSLICAYGRTSQEAVASIFEPDAITGVVRNWSPIYGIDVKVSFGYPDAEHK